MSAAKRATVRGKKVTKKPAAKATVVKRASKKGRAQSATKLTAKTAAKVAKKTTKTSTKRTTKKATTRARKKVVTRVVKRPSNAPAQSVREARYGGHQNTIPKNPKAPGRLLGRSVSLSSAGLISANPFNADAIAIALARFGGIGIMVCGAALSWNIYNQLVALPTQSQTATVIDAAVVTEPDISVAGEQPVQEPTSVVVSYDNAEKVLLTLEQASTTYVLGAAHQRTAASWEYRLDPAMIVPGSYTLQAHIAAANDFVTIAADEELVIPNPSASEMPLPGTTVATTSTSTTVTTSPSSSTPRTVAPAATAALPTTTMPTLLAPTVAMIAPWDEQTARILGEGSAHQVVELLLLRVGVRATTTVQANGWWTLTIPMPQPGDAYELYAQATPELLSGPLDFRVIAGRLTRPQPSVAHATLVAESDPQQSALVWYLVVAVGIVSLGTVLLLIGHHLHQLRRHEEAERQLDQVA